MSLAPADKLIGEGNYEDAAKVLYNDKIDTFTFNEEKILTNMPYDKIAREKLYIYEEKGPHSMMALGIGFKSDNPFRYPDRDDADSTIDPTLTEAKASGFDFSWKLVLPYHLFEASKAKGFRDPKLDKYFSTNWRNFGIAIEHAHWYGTNGLFDIVVSAKTATVKSNSTFSDTSPYSGVNETLNDTAFPTITLKVDRKSTSTYMMRSIRGMPICFKTKDPGSNGKVGDTGTDYIYGPFVVQNVILGRVDEDGAWEDHSITLIEYNPKTAKSLVTGDGRDQIGKFVSNSNFGTSSSASNGLIGFLGEINSVSDAAYEVRLVCNNISWKSSDNALKDYVSLYDIVSNTSKELYGLDPKKEDRWRPTVINQKKKLDYTHLLNSINAINAVKDTTVPSILFMADRSNSTITTEINKLTSGAIVQGYSEKVQKWGTGTVAIKAANDYKGTNKAVIPTLNAYVKERDIFMLTNLKIKDDWVRFGTRDFKENKMMKGINNFDTMENKQSLYTRYYYSGQIFCNHPYRQGLITNFTF